MDHTAGPVRVVLVDDQRHMRQAVRTLLEFAGCDVVGEADDGPSGVDLCRSVAPDVLVTDLRMPGLNGVGVARLVRADHPGVQVVLFTADPAGGTRLLDADGIPAVVVAKGAMPEVLVHAVLGSPPPVHTAGGIVPINPKGGES